MASHCCKVTQCRVSSSFKLQLSNPGRPQSAYRRRQQHVAYSTANPGYYSSAEQQEPDLLSGMLNSCLAATAHWSDMAVSKLADALQAVAPPQAPRQKIEVSVKGALVLLLLGLLKGVISFVLLVGCIGLAVYTATQVFGWTGLVLGQSGSNYGAGGGFEQQHPYSQPPQGAPYQQGYGPQGPYRQQHKQQQQQQFDNRQAGQRPQQQRRPPGDQGDLVDVFHFGGPAPQ